MIDINHQKISQSHYNVNRLGLDIQGYIITLCPFHKETCLLMNAIDEEYTRHPFRGNCGMTDHL